MNRLVLLGTKASLFAACFLRKVLVRLSESKSIAKGATGSFMTKKERANRPALSVTATGLLTA